VHKLVYFEAHAEMYGAIQREKRLKKWNRAWKISLIEEMNPEWKPFRGRHSDFLNGVPAFAGTTIQRFSELPQGELTSCGRRGG